MGNIWWVNNIYEASDSQIKAFEPDYRHTLVYGSDLTFENKYLAVCLYHELFSLKHTTGCRF